DYEGQTAKEKHEYVQQCIDQSEYTVLPEISELGFGIINLLWPSYIAKAFTNNGDEMEADREKVINKSDVTINIEFDVNNDSALNLSGLFASGAEHGVLRLSLAEPSSVDNFKPGFAIKLFRNGKASANIFAMPSLDGSASSNLLALDFVTSLPEPTWSI